MPPVVRIEFTGPARHQYSPAPAYALRAGDVVVAETEWGVGMGHVGSILEDLPPEEPKAPVRRVLRKATPTDLSRRAALAQREREVRWGPRTLDLDLLLYEGETRAGPELTVPHPRMWERAFITVPLRELLTRVPWFDRPEWTEARTRLAAAPLTAGVTRWTPPSA